MAATSANDFLAKMMAGNPEMLAKLQAKQQATNERNAGISSLAQQLGGQASQYGFSWKGNKSADFHQGKMAKILYDKGVRSLSDIGYNKERTKLINKNTGQVIPYYKDNKPNKEGVAQIGWESGGKGRTNYYVRPDANGNAVFTPKWKSNAPGGIGGFLLKYAAPVISVFNPAIGTAVGAALGLAQGQKFGDIAKGAALNYGLSTLGRGISNAATARLPMIGNAGITNAIADAAGSAAAGGARGILTGQNPIKSALTGAATGAVGSGIGQLVGEMPSTGNATLDKFLQAGAKTGLKGAINPAVAGLFNGSGGVNTGRGVANQNQNQAGGQPGLAGLDTAKLLPLLAAMGQNRQSAAPAQNYSGPTSNTNWLYSTPQQQPIYG